MIVKYIKWITQKTTCRIGRAGTIFDHVIVVFRQFFPGIRENGPREYALWRSCIEISNRLISLNLLS